MLDFLYNIIIYPLYQIIEIVYLLVYKLFKNSGYAVLGVSVAVTFLCLPLYIIAEKWQEVERDKQKEMKPGIDRIKKAFKGDEQYMILTTYYKQNHYHPLMALRSSFSLLIQIPFFIAAYKYLSNLEELRGLSFLFIKDMGAPDAMFSIGNFKINILPIAMTLINICSGIIYCKDLTWKDRAPIFIMALFFLVLLYNSPAGLVVYWTMNNIFSLVKNIFYKMKNPLKVLYISLCCCSFILLYFLLFKHNGFLYKRIILSVVVSLVFFIPFILKLINYFLNNFCSSLSNNTKLRNLLYFASISGLVLLLGLYLPTSVIVSSPAEFSFIGENSSPFFIIKNSIPQIMGFLFCWCTAIYFLYGKKIKVIFSILFSILLLSAIINSFLFPGSYGLLSPILAFSNPIMLKATTRLNLINILCLLIPIVFIFILIKANKIKVLNYILLFICFGFISISSINLIKINSGYKQTKKIIEANNQTINKIEPIFNLSKENENVLIIMLDRGVNAFIPEILKEKPELEEKLSGFICYSNTASFSSNTIFGSPALYGGYEYTPVEINKRDNEILVNKHNEALLLMPTLFSNIGFETTVTDPSWCNYSWVPDLSIFDNTKTKAYRTLTKYTDVWLATHKNIGDIDVQENLMKRNFIWYSLLRTMPTIFREMLYDDGYYWNTEKSVQDLQAAVNNYAVLDYLPELTSFDSTSGTFTLIVNELTHEPSYLQAPDYTPSTKITNYGNGKYSKDMHYHANIGSFLRLSEFFDYLKENEVYDNTRIIIVSDHAIEVPNDRFTGDYPLRDPVTYNPLLLIKDFNAKGNFTYNNDFMTNADVPLLATKDIIDNPINVFTGKPLSDEMKKNGIPIISPITWAPDGQNKYTLSTKDTNWYFVKEDITNPNNWKKITEDQAMTGDY